MKKRISDEFWKVERNDRNTPVDPLPDIVDPRVIAAVAAARDELGFEYFVHIDEGGIYFVHIGSPTDDDSLNKVYGDFVGEYRIEDAGAYGYDGCVRIERVAGAFPAEEIIVEWDNLPRALYNMVKTHMTDNEAIATVEAGGRCTTERTLDRKEWNVPESECRPHHFRVVACNNKRDVLECIQCGRQTTAKCRFDDDYS